MIMIKVNMKNPIVFLVITFMIVNIHIEEVDISTKVDIIDIKMEVSIIVEVDTNIKLVINMYMEVDTSPKIDIEIKIIIGIDINKLVFEIIISISAINISKNNIVNNKKAHKKKLPGLNPGSFLCQIKISRFLRKQNEF